MTPGARIIVLGMLVGLVLIGLTLFVIDRAAGAT